METRARSNRLVGAHTSIAGSLQSAALEALDLGCNTFQIFSRSPRMWRAPALKTEEIEQFAALRAQHRLRPLIVHASYLLNLASADSENRTKSIIAFREELERAIAIGAEYLVLHPGSAKSQSPEAAIAALAEAFAEAASEQTWDGLILLLENTAGGGASLGRNFTELAAIRQAIAEWSPAAPVGFCIDTAHAFAAGFDLSTEAGLEETLAAAEAAIGLDAIRVVHCNDSKTKLGSRLDRHARLGEGRIGWQAMKRIVNHPKLRAKPFILETPHDEDGTHRRNVQDLKRLIAE